MGKKHKNCPPVKHNDFDTQHLDEQWTVFLIGNLFIVVLSCDSC